MMYLHRIFAVLLALAVLPLMPMANAQSAATNQITQFIDRQLENFITLNTRVVASFASEPAGENSISLGTGITLVAPNISAKSYAGALSRPNGLSFNVVRNDTVRVRATAGVRGTLDLAGGVFPGGFGANEGILGLTPTVGGQLYVGNSALGVLAESETGVGGPKNGWLGSISAAYNVVDNVPSPYRNSHSGLSEILLGISLSAMDATYATNVWAVDADDTQPLGLESLTLGATAAFDIGNGLRLMTPVSARLYLGDAETARGDDGTIDWRAGLSVGYRFK